MNAPTLQKFNCNEQSQNSWLDRALVCAELVREIAPPDRPVELIDIGCGDMKLSNHLQLLGIGVHYHGYDLIPQVTEVKKINIEIQTPDQTCDIFVLLGVSEYLDNLEDVLTRLSRRARYLIVSHVVSDRSNYSNEHLSKLNWKNHLRQIDFELLLSSTGYSVAKTRTTLNKRTIVWLCESSATQT